MNSALPLTVSLKLDHQGGVRVLELVDEVEERLPSGSACCPSCCPRCRARGRRRGGSRSRPCSSLAEVGDLLGHAVLEQLDVLRAPGRARSGRPCRRRPPSPRPRRPRPRGRRASGAAGRRVPGGGRRRGGGGPPAGEDAARRAAASRAGTPCALAGAREAARQRGTAPPRSTTTTRGTSTARTKSTSVDASSRRLRSGLARPAVRVVEAAGATDFAACGTRAAGAPTAVPRTTDGERVGDVAEDRGREQGARRGPQRRAEHVERVVHRGDLVADSSMAVATRTARGPCSRPGTGRTARARGPRAAPAPRPARAEARPAAPRMPRGRSPGRARAATP